MKKILALITALVFLGIMASSVQATQDAPRIRIKDGTSSNWAGYAVLTSLTSPQKNVVTDVKGSWIVPTVDCSVTPNAYSAYWIGIDGYSSNTVEQIGTDSDCSSGSPSYDAWYEMYPKFPVYLNLKISPGDSISAEVKFLGSGKFQLSINDLTSKKSFTTTQKSSSAKRTSAEWIAEAPWSSGVLPLADFRTVTFTNAQAILNGHTGTISDAAWQKDKIDMATSSGALKAQTSGLSNSGSSFSINWISSGP